eukprot:CAMPEP_0194573076 /NCGR_PEP_ID=MMETSP0292-20121207/9415_1 /TAXON_ID=39354 /ORGANISM="Heterosigma akashiwo, Strain CCMP2393" /LENGTH=77 /DNA_ID=CAMNT_0039424211 /DNA_START=285 /DNA_END=518 /DNA_ORIENTATION=-
MEGHADSYEGLKIKQRWRFFKDKPPVIHFFDNDAALIETHSIERMSTNEIHELVQSKGLQRTAEWQEAQQQALQQEL